MTERRHIAVIVSYDSSINEHTLDTMIDDINGFTKDFEINFSHVNPSFQKIMVPSDSIDAIYLRRDDVAMMALEQVKAFAEHYRRWMISKRRRQLVGPVDNAFSDLWKQAYTESENKPLIVRYNTPPLWKICRRLPPFLLHGNSTRSF